MLKDFMRIKIVASSTLMLFLFTVVSLSHAFSLPPNYTKEVTLYIPAVEKTAEGYRGVLATLIVAIKPGNGRVFVDTLPLTEIDTQAGARVAKEAVEDLLKVNLDNYDLFYIIRSDSPIVGGPSAGGAMATATLAAVLNLTIDPGVVMTGTINPDGSIGPVGGLLEKAQAVAEHNGSIFLIPEGQAIVRVQQTEEKRLPFGVEIVSKPVTIDLREYAKEKWNLSVVEVSNIKEALEYMTGYTFETKEIKINTSERLKQVMKEIAEEMFNETKMKFNEADKKMKESKIPYQYEVQLNELLSKQENNINEIEELYEKEHYYSAASQCFSTMIQLTRIKYIVDFLEASNRETFLDSALTNAEKKIEDVEKRIEEEEKEMDNINDIEVIAIASERISDAKSNIKEAWKNYYNARYFDSIYYLSYAEERVNTAEKWLLLTKKFTGKSLNISKENFKGLASLRIGEALSFITYAKLLNIDTTRAEDQVALARNNFDEGKYLTALFNAITARAEVDFLLEVNGLSNEEIEQRLDYFEQEAKEDIYEAQSYGCLPILAFNYYEYAKSLEESDASSAAIYYTYAKHFAKVSKNLAEVFEGKEFSEKEKGVTIKPIERKVQCEENIFIIVVIFLTGLAIGILSKRI